MKQYHFITGLPRSGSTILTALLNQNPRFHSSISDPLAAITRATVNEATGNPGFRSECPPDRVKNTCLGAIDGFYKHIDKPVIFNTNRAWTTLLPITTGILPNSKYIACVRDVGWVIDSFEVLMRKNAFTLTTIFSRDEMASVYTRAKALIGDGRVVGQAYNGLKQAMSSEYRDLILVVEYENLCKNPEKTMQDIYGFLGYPYFEHDFDNVESSHDEYDAEIGVKGLHDTRKKIEFIERDTILPPDIWQSVKNWEFWRDPNWYKARPNTPVAKVQTPQQNKSLPSKASIISNNTLPISGFLKK